MRAGLPVLLLWSGLIHGEIIDRVAVSIGNAVITESEILRQIRITAMINGQQPEISPDLKRETAERLVEQALIRREIAVNRYMPGDTGRARGLYEQFLKKFPTPEDYKRTLETYRLTDIEISEAFEWQATLLDFIDVRFRPGIQVQDDEIRDYYDRELMPQMAKTSPEARVSFEEARADIERILVEQRVDNALDRWLGQARTQLRITFRQEVFR